MHLLVNLWMLKSIHAIVAALGINFTVAFFDVEKKFAVK